MLASRLGLLAKLPNHRFLVPDHVREEITLSEQRETLDAAITEGCLTVAVITDTTTLTLFTELINHVGRGEAACIALAVEQGWYIASDEKKRFLREATARVGSGRIITTIDVFVLAINAGLLTPEEADADKRLLEGRRFRMPFASFRDLMK